MGAGDREEIQRTSAGAVLRQVAVLASAGLPGAGAWGCVGGNQAAAASLVPHPPPPPPPDRQFAALFSFGSLAATVATAPQIIRLFRRQSVPTVLRFVVAAYFLAAVNTWTWSTLFHIRDVTLTEHMDYLSGNLLAAVTAALSVVLVMRVRSLLIGLVISLLAAAHGAFRRLFAFVSITPPPPPTPHLAQPFRVVLYFFAAESTTETT